MPLSQYENNRYIYKSIYNPNNMNVHVLFERINTNAAPSNKTQLQIDCDDVLASILEKNIKT